MLMLHLEGPVACAVCLGAASCSWLRTCASRWAMRALRCSSVHMRSCLCAASCAFWSCSTCTIRALS